MIELDDNSYIVGIWFSSCPKTGNDWMGCLIKNPEDSTNYQGWSRLRYVNTKSSGEDEKIWRHFTTKDNESEEEMIKFMDLTQSRMDEVYSVQDKIIVKGSLSKLISLSKDKDWLVKFMAQ